MLKFERGNVYRHRNTLDIDIVVVSEVFFSEESTGFTVKYWNRNSRIFQGKPEFIRIKYSELSKWKKIC